MALAGSGLGQQLLLPVVLILQLLEQATGLVCWHTSPNSLLKNAIVAFFNLAKCEERLARLAK